MRVAALVGLLAAPAVAVAMGAEAGAGANPIRRVVQMMQKMEQKVEKEGEKQKDMFEKYMCYCETSAAALAKSIGDAEEKIPQVEAEIKEVGGAIAQLESDLKAHKAARTDAEKTIEEQMAMREKDAASFAAESGEFKSNIEAMARAIPAIEKGMGGAFLQSAMGKRVQKLLNSQEATLTSADASSVTAFLQDSSQYSPASGEIVGILKQMKEEMEADLKEITEAENESIASFTALKAAKDREIAVNTKAIEEKTARLGNSGVELANMKHDLEDTQEQLVEDKKFQADLTKGCSAQEKNWEVIQKVRQQELAALADTIKLLNDDDSLELFKKTVPAKGEAFLQMAVQSKQARARAMSLVQRALRHRQADPQIELIALALRGKKVGFEKVTKMIDEMVVVLGKEQEDDATQKEWCLKEFDQTEDKMKSSTHTIAGLESKIADSTEAVKTLASEIQDLEDGIAKLDLQVAAATQQRKEEHDDFTTDLANNNAALEILGIAKNRLNKFYNPKAYVAPVTPVPTEEQRQYFAATGEVPPELTAAPQIPAQFQGDFVEVADETEAAPAPPPAALPAYKKSGSASNGVLGMIDSIVNEVKMEVQDMQMEEKEAQKDYEQMVADAGEKRRKDTKSIEDKSVAKSEVEQELQQAKDDHKAESRELLGLKQYFSELHGQCDFLLDNFDVRKEARTNEIEALKKAKAVLAGADYSFVQTSFLSKRQ